MMNIKKAILAVSLLMAIGLFVKLEVELAGETKPVLNLELLNAQAEDDGEYDLEFDLGSIPTTNSVAPRDLDAIYYSRYANQ